MTELKRVLVMTLMTMTLLFVLAAVAAAGLLALNTLWTFIKMVS